MTALKTTLFVAVAVSAIACSGRQKTVLSPTSEVPAALGEVHTTRTGNDNTEVEVDVRHLAPPGEVVRGATTYVVWAKPHTGDARAHNVGAMRVGDAREGSLKTKTPFETFDVFVTPEASPNTPAPTNDAVLEGKVGR